MKGKLSYLKFLALLSVVSFFNHNAQALTCDSVSLRMMEQTWREFRTIHPFGFQTVGLKQKGDTCIFVMSEPAECVKAEELQGLFNEYEGQLIIGRKSFGYDGGLYDAIGCVLLDHNRFQEFEKRLFLLLYGSDYKPYYTNLDMPFEHIYFSDIKLDYYVSGLFWNNWEKNEKFIVPSQNDQTIDKLSLLKTGISNELFYSRKRGFVLWKINPIEISLTDTLFRANARIFTLDTDLIVHSFFKDDYLYIVGREREIPVTVLPPLRSETICSIIKNGRRKMSVIILPDSMISINDAEDSTYWATPIMMNQSLRNTEFGNLLLLADFMLKSWSENANVRDLFVDYPLPASFFTQKGVANKLGYPPKYIWELSSFRTGSIYPSYKTRNDSITDLTRKVEMDAFDYFSGLNNTDLVRICQYASIIRPFLLYPLLASKTKTTIEKDSIQWGQSPSMTVSDNPWGYGGVIMQAPLAIRTIVKNLASRGIKTPPNLPTILQYPHVRTAVQNEQLAWERVIRAKSALNRHSTPSTRQELKNANAAYARAKKNLNSAISPYIIHQPVSASKLAERISLSNNPRAVLINPSLGYSQRGFVPEKHNVLPKSQKLDSKVELNDEQVKRPTSSWRERLQKKVFEKSHKINTIETKGNLYMIYGYIIKFNDDGEYLSNYAA